MILRRKQHVVCVRGGSSDVVMWSVYIHQMNINWGKTKKMLIGTNTTGSIDDILCKGNNTIECVNTFKLLGVHIDSNLKWASHVDSMCAKASSRLFFLKMLKRC